MSSQLTRLETQLLLGATDDLTRLKRGKPVPGVKGFHAIRDAKEDAADGLVKLATARWLGMETLPAAGRMAAARAFKRLEARGLAQRHALYWSESRPNYLQITTAGRKLAKQLREAEANE